MPSSLNQPMSESGLSGGSGFGFGWRSDKGSGPETVITNPRGGPAPGSSPEIAIFEKDLVGRLFPTTHDAEHVAGIIHSCQHAIVFRYYHVAGSIREGYFKEIALAV